MSLLLISTTMSFAGSLLALRLLLSSPLRGLAVDRPNERSLHYSVVPRTGGLAILAGTTLGLGFEWNRQTLGLWGIALVLATVSLMDDRYGLAAGVRLAAQLATAIAVVALIGLDQPWWWFPFAVITTVWMTNLYNFMDGADGMAGGMGISGFSAYALSCAIHDAADLAALCACLAAGCAGFLTRNYPPATIFMGDVGSTVLGFLAAAVGLYGNALGIWPLWFPALVFLPFALDATITLLRRASRRERVWQAHREHYYQRLIRGGWTHARTANVAYLLMTGTAISGSLTLETVPDLGWVVLLAWLVALAVLMGLVDSAQSSATDPR